MNASWSDRDVEETCEALSELLGIGVPLLSALATVAQGRSPRLREALMRVSADLQAGRSLASALARAGMPETVVALIRVGEESGELPGALRVAADYARDRVRLRQRLRQLLVYPFVVLLTLTATLTFLLFGVLPRFAELYAAMAVSLPLATRTVLWLGKGLAQGMMLAAAGAALMGCAAFILRRAAPARLETLRVRLARLLWRAPVLARLARDERARFVAFHVGRLLDSGVPLRRALEVCASSAPSEIWRKEVNRLAEAVTAGASFVDALKGGDYPPLLLQAAWHGEATGRLGRCLLRAAEALDAERKRRIQRAVHLLEPLLVLGTGALLLLVVLTLFLPLFNLMDQL
ncbi:type II secretion system F family protein [Calditerricola satsumensis]|uniref:Fimbrial assembly protein PilC n=2 Tax=Calditerricola satsumensis TaxID=373054 RepID=A0A8J3BHU0_9BACI|nr:type II secretion system F family protein [Calditerricola satsumensis]GGK04707.1 fimbrial assembly protein PilC [Calditerricola satsumensis]